MQGRRVPCTKGNNISCCQSRVSTNTKETHEKQLETTSIHPFIIKNETKTMQHSKENSRNTTDDTGRMRSP